MSERDVSKLPVVDPTPDSTILPFDGRPIVRGKGVMDLVCGHCGAVIVNGQTATEVALQYKVLDLLVRCVCGSYNSFSSKSAHLPDRERQIAEAAYFRAQKRGFAPGYALQDWIDAERQVDG